MDISIVNLDINFSIIPDDNQSLSQPAPQRMELIDQNDDENYLHSKK